MIIFIDFPKGIYSKYSLDVITYKTLREVFLKLEMRRYRVGFVCNVSVRLGITGKILTIKGVKVERRRSVNG